MGTLNGSLIVVDSRSGVLLLLCLSIVKSPITQVRYMNSSIVLLTNSVNMYVYKDIIDLG